MKAKQTRGKVYISLVSVLLLAAPAAAFADEQDCVAFIAQAQALNASALDQDALLNTDAATELNVRTYSIITGDAVFACIDVPRGDSRLVGRFLRRAEAEVRRAGISNAVGDAVSATLNETDANISLEIASEATVLGVP